MLGTLREWLRKVTTKPCEACGEPVPVADYRETGETRPGTLCSGGELELACPHCGDTFWVRK